MQLISLNVGKPQPYNYLGKQGTTSIYKCPVKGPHNVSLTNIEGDEQADLRVHGGELKAVYSYDVSYYDHWKNILQRDDWTHGLFGENLTTTGLPDDKVFIGNIYKVGSVYLKAIQPRFPCYKLNIRFNNEDMLHEFMLQGRHGTYFSVVQPGTLQAGDEIKLVEQSKHTVTIQQLVSCYYNKRKDKALLQKVQAIDFLPEKLKKAFVV